MGLFSFLRKNKQKDQKEIINMNLEEVPDFVSNRLQGKVNNVNSQANQLTEKIMTRFKELNNLFIQLKEKEFSGLHLPTGSCTSCNSIDMTTATAMIRENYCKKASNSINSFLEKKEASFAETVRQALKIYALINDISPKQIQLLFLTFKKEMSIIGSKLKEIQNGTRTAEEFLEKDYVIIRQIENIKGRVEKIKQARRDKKEIENSKEKIKNQIVLLEKEKSEKEEKFNELLNSAEVIKLNSVKKEVSSLGENKKRIGQEAEAQLNLIEKQIKKFLYLQQRGRDFGDISMKEITIIKKILDNSQYMFENEHHIIIIKIIDKIEDYLGEIEQDKKRQQKFLKIADNIKESIEEINKEHKNINLNIKKLEEQKEQLRIVEEKIDRKKKEIEKLKENILDLEKESEFRALDNEEKEIKELNALISKILETETKIK